MPGSSRDPDDAAGATMVAVVLDRELRLVRYTIITDQELMGDCEDAISSGVTVERGRDPGAERYYVRRVVPTYRADGQVDGVMVLLADMTDLRAPVAARARSEAALEIAAAERRSLARDLHDALGGTLTGIAMLGETLRGALAESGSPEADRAAELARQIQRFRDELRRIAAGMVPVELAGRDLGRALAELAQQMERLHGIPIRATIDARAQVDDLGVALQLWFIAQEAITNAVRHGRARAIQVRLARQDRAVVLDIRDDGIGIPPAEQRRPGDGLRTMRWRAAAIGAGLEIGVPPEGGTAVTCILPQWNRPSVSDHA